MQDQPGALGPDSWKQYWEAVHCSTNTKITAESQVKYWHVNNILNDGLHMQRHKTVLEMIPVPVYMYISSKKLDPDHAEGQ